MVDVCGYERVVGGVRPGEMSECSSGGEGEGYEVGVDSGTAPYETRGVLEDVSNVIDVYLCRDNERGVGCVSIIFPRPDKTE